MPALSQPALQLHGGSEVSSIPCQGQNGKYRVTNDCTMQRQPGLSGAHHLPIQPFTLSFTSWPRTKLSFSSSQQGYFCWHSQTFLSFSDPIALEQAPGFMPQRKFISFCHLFQPQLMTSWLTRVSCKCLKARLAIHPDLQLVTWLAMQCFCFTSDAMLNIISIIYQY